MQMLNALPLPDPAVEGAADVEQIMFFASHSLDTVDARLYLHYSRQLRFALQPTRTRLWLLLYQSKLPDVRIAPAEATAIEGGACSWGDGALRAVFPRLASAIDTNADISRTPQVNHRRYWWFHASLLLWNRSFGHAYPRLRYWWRVEPDVLFSGSWADLLLRTSRRDEDVVLPRLISYAHDPTYPHWPLNQHLLRDVPNDQWLYSLVSIGRYSSRFIAHMAREWRAGAIGYEEVSLPMGCVKLGRDRCRLASFQRLRSGGWRTSYIANYFRYRPAWKCGEFLLAAASHTQEIWHPVKNRTCWVRYLDTCSAQGCATRVE
mmetsp:Transcript_50982/g.108939  ORF Transcript_50982/g.108939 Transcript_50982/m.108939 type:complete len:320 (-) Transcript_50982:231-1190(-)